MQSTRCNRVNSLLVRYQLLITYYNIIWKKYLSPNSFVSRPINKKLSGKNKNLVEISFR